MSTFPPQTMSGPSPRILEKPALHTQDTHKVIPKIEASGGDTDVKVFKTYQQAEEEIITQFTEGRVPEIIFDEQEGVYVRGLDLSPIVTPFSAETEVEDVMSWVDGFKPGDFKAITFHTKDLETGKITPLERKRLELVKAAYVDKGYIHPGDEAADEYTELGLQIPFLIVGKNLDGKNIVWGGFRIIAPHVDAITSHGLSVPAGRLPAHSLIHEPFIGRNGEVWVGKIPHPVSTVLEISQMVINIVDKDLLPREMITAFCLEKVLGAYSQFRSDLELPEVRLWAIISASPSYIEMIGSAKLAKLFMPLIKMYGKIPYAKKETMYEYLDRASNYFFKKQFPKRKIERMLNLVREAPGLVEYFSKVHQPHGSKKNVEQRGSKEVNFVMEII